MSTDLVVLNNIAIQTGGLGLTNSKLFALKPSTIELVQGMSRAEGAIPGKLRISDTGQHFDEMQLVMLFEPVQQRAYFEGSEMTKAAKLCFSTDNDHPHDRAQVPQAANCDRCPMQDWTKWRGDKKKENLPKCKQYWHAGLRPRYPAALLPEREDDQHRCVRTRNGSACQARGTDEESRREPEYF